MSRTQAAALLLLLVPLAWAAMLAGWRGRARRQAGEFPALPSPPAAPGEPLLGEPVEVTYVSTTAEGDWLDRVVPHGLGHRGVALASVTTAALELRRRGEQDLVVPASQLLGVRLDRGIAGKVVSEGGLVVVTWQWGARRVDTGVRTRRREDTPVLVGAVRELLEAGRG